MGVLVQVDRLLMVHSCLGRTGGRLIRTAADLVRETRHRLGVVHCSASMATIPRLSHRVQLPHRVACDPLGQAACMVQGK